MPAKITMAHGSGGEMSSRLVADIFYKAFRTDVAKANDAAVMPLAGGRVAFTTDSFVVSPLFFPGGNIGKLAFCGTVNDLAAVGAKPAALAASFIIEEGLDLGELDEIARTIGQLSVETGIPIVTGDTKVVEKGSADKVFITTTGIGVVPHDLHYHPERIAPGDKIIVSGTIGDHGYCITALREGIAIKSKVTSDCQPLHTLVASLAGLGGGVHAIRDATRGGVGTVLNEWALQCGCQIVIGEDSLPIREEVKGGCNMLGLEPLYLANEGKMIFAVSGGKAEEALSILRQHPAGKDAAVIGQVDPGQPRLLLDTQWGTRRIIPVPSGEILPRIC